MTIATILFSFGAVFIVLLWVLYRVHYVIAQVNVVMRQVLSLSDQVVKLRENSRD